MREQQEGHVQWLGQTRRQRRVLLKHARCALLCGWLQAELGLTRGELGTTQARAQKLLEMLCRCHAATTAGAAGSLCTALVLW